MRNTKKMYEDEDYGLIQKSGLFGITWPVVCSYWVVNKSRGHALKATAQEKGYLLATLQYYTQLGGDPRRLTHCGLLRDFCEAVAARDGMLSRYFFESETPASRAKLILGQ